ncbi:unnamed protein product [Acanthocheilonema viteae]|uniref:Uncharacterized protein n=1 Tax=Acanthocheilonema viteae TaxID=6277 RepID=A0A498SQC8_ACAVI|nr:unnamed protein product [Acanthocheilonema viteae]
MTSQTTSSNSWKNAKKEGSIEIVNDRLTAEDLSSVIGLMAYGSLLKDIDKNVRRRGSRKYAGRSVTDFNLPLSASSSSSSSRISINYSKNTRRIMEKIVKNQANNMNNSLSEREIQECSENFTYKSTNDDDHSNSSVCSSLTTLNDTANRNRKRKVKWKNHKNDRKNDRIVRRDAITDNDQLFSCVSVSNTKSSTKSYHSSEGTTTNIIAGEITPDDDESMRSTIANNSSLARKLIHTWIRKNDDKKGMNDSYDSTQQNLTMQQNSVSRAFSSHQSNSALRAFPECQLDSISRDRKQSSSSSAETINSFSNENMGQNQQLTYEAPQLTDDIRRWTPSESERMNSTQTNIRSIQSIRIPSTYQLENIPKFSQLNNVDYFTSESFYQGREQICHQSGKYTSILSTIPLKTETYTASEGSRRCSTDYEPSLPYTSAKNQQIIDCCTNFEQSIESHSTTDVQHSHPELSKITSISSELSAISNCSNSGKELKLLDEKVEEMEQSSSVEEGLKMKMNITLMPQRYQSLDEHIEIEEHHSDQESTPIGSISSYHSTATTTTYESTQDLSIIK